MSKKEKDLLNNYRKADDNNKKAIYWYAAIAAKAKHQKGKKGGNYGFNQLSGMQQASV